MKFHIPNYYKEFKCIATKCKDNCCKTNWEIDIDDKTVQYYESLNTPFGNKLKKSIKKGNPCTMIFDQDGKCPFLNENNLCSVYLNLGEEHLGNICTNHPRYYEWFSNFKEGGIGLCCEEAARIILSQTQNFSIEKISIPNEDYDKYDEKLFNYLYNLRDTIIEYLETPNKSIDSKILDILVFSDKIQNNIDTNNLKPETISEINFSKANSIIPLINFYKELEPLKESWIKLLDNSVKRENVIENKINEFEKANPELDLYLQNISIYFIWRYLLKSVFDNDIISKTTFMFISLKIIKYLLFCRWLDNNKLNFDDYIEISKMYSEEIEYCVDNMDKLSTACFDNYFFTIDYLKNLNI